jgi:AcrR family transcriptional regulator
VRRIPEDRFATLIEAATRVLIARGYRLTQMADVAEAVGVAKGTLYGYVASKEALFQLCVDDAVRRGGGDGPLVQPAVLPVPTPRPGTLTRRLREGFEKHGALSRLDAALAGEPADDVDEELRAILGEMYDVQHAFATAIELVENAAGHPELGERWYEMGRDRNRERLERYLILRTESGALRRFEDPRLAARFAIECIATWAMHILWDPHPDRFDPASMRENTLEFLVRGMRESRDS